MALDDTSIRVARGLRSPFVEVRLWACRRASDKAVTVDERQLRSLFIDRSRRVRRAVVRCVAVRRLTSAVPDLIEVLNSGDVDLSLQAAVALEAISAGTKPAVRPRPLVPSQARPMVARPTLRAVDFREPTKRDTDVPRPVRSIAPLPGEPGFDGGTAATALNPAIVVFAAFFAIVGAFLGGVHWGQSKAGLEQSHPVVQTDEQPLLTFETGQVASGQQGIEQGSEDTPGVTAGQGQQGVTAGQGQQGVTVGLDRQGMTAGLDQQGATVGPQQGARPDGLPAGWARKEAVWLSLARRYLAAGRPKACFELVERILATNPGCEGAQGLKRLARERYGVIE